MYNPDDKYVIEFFLSFYVIELCSFRIGHGHKLNTVAQGQAGQADTYNINLPENLALI